MRLFVAIDIPEDIKEYLFHIQKKLPDDDSISMRKTTDFHCTLKFLGSVDGNKRREVEHILETIPFQPFTAELASIGTFGFRGLPRVIWIGLKVPDWIVQSQRLIEEKLKPLGFEMENRFSPHLTLGRIKFVQHAKSFEETIAKIQVEPKKFHVDGFSLFESHLSPRGVTYEKLKKFSGAAL